MKILDHLTSDPRVTVRRPGAPDPKGCVVYWMQRAQRALDNPALDVAVEAANILQQPVVIFFAGARAQSRNWVCTASLSRTFAGEIL
jgi:hypothetical protein